MDFTSINESNYFIISSMPLRCPLQSRKKCHIHHLILIWGHIKRRKLLNSLEIHYLC